MMCSEKGQLLKFGQFLGVSFYLSLLRMVNYDDALLSNNHTFIYDQLNLFGVRGSEHEAIGQLFYR